MSRFRRKFKASVVWAAFESMVHLLAALCITLVVGRIIGPAEFGLAAVAFLIGSFAEIFVSMPFYEPLIQRRRLTGRLVDAAFTAMVATGLGVYLLILVSSPLFAQTYEQPRLRYLLAVQGLACLFAGVRGVPEALMARKLRFSQIAVRNIVAKLSGAIVSLAAALAGMGAWSIILGNVVFAFGTTVLVISMTKRIPRFAIDVRGVASLWSFGMFSLVENLLWSAAQRLFCFFVSYYQGLQALGQLTIAFRISDAGWTFIYTVGGRLALPMLSRVAEDRKRLEQAFLQGTQMVSLIVCPVFLGLALTSPEIVNLLLGPEWPLATPALAAVSIFSLCIAIRLLADSAVKAVGKPSLLIMPNLLGLLYVSAGSFVMRNGDFQAQLWVWITFGFVFVMLSLRAVQKAIGTNWFTQLKPLGPAVLPSLGLCGAVYGITKLQLGVSPVVLLPLKVALGALVYVSILVVLERPQLMLWLKGSTPVASGDKARS
jgi:O-antigen/teichoic acid export membrane protein